MDDKTMGEFYKRETQNLLESIGDERVNELFSYEFCEMEQDFVGFINNYADLKALPRDFTIIDIGCNQAFQADYFKNHAKYIGIEPGVPIQNRLRQDNAEYYEQTLQEFVEKELPRLAQSGLDPNKTFAICSAVPDSAACKLTEDTFRYFRISYPGRTSLVSYPKGFDAKNFATTENIADCSPHKDKNRQAEINEKIECLEILASKSENGLDINY